jgi:hypothetical protein
MAITSLPYEIKSPGLYRLTSHMSTNITSGNAITIEADDVVLDLNGFKLDGSRAGAETEAKGIYALDRENLTIRNGTVTGFKKAIFIDETNVNIEGNQPSDTHIVELIRATQNNFTGIEVVGFGSVIRNNLVVNNGGIGIKTTGGVVSGNSIMGIGKYGVGIGDGFDVGWGIMIENGRVSVKNNYISNTRSGDPSYPGACIVIGDDTSDVLISNNHLVASQVGIFFEPGVVPGSCKYTNTLTMNVGTLVSGTGTAVAVGIND